MSLTLTINDDLVSAGEGQTLLEAIRDAGISLPTLCHLDGLSERGGCRLCLVEVEGTSRPVPACLTPARDEMVVRTHTDRLMRYRKMIVEMLLAERNHICAVCFANRHCELQSVAADIGVDHVRYDYVCPRLSMDTSHERYGIDHNRCILCLRCVRACDEVEGAHTLDVKGRGTESFVITDLDRPWGESGSCTGCGKCVQVCPTGTLFVKGIVISEIRREPGFLTRILDGRNKRQWSR